MALIGNIEQFKGSGEEFGIYMERIEHLFEVNAVQESMKVSMLITLAGPGVYLTLKNLVSPKRPSEFTFVEIKKALVRHYCPPVSEIFERFKFNKCNQQADQSVAEYVIELRKLASTCNFGNFLDDALRDRFVCGLRTESIQKILLAETGITFNEACKKAQLAESAQKQVRSLSDAGDLNLVQRRVEKKHGGRSTKYPVPQKGSCNKCGRNHPKEPCPAEKWKCYRCHKVGHVKALCPKGGRGTIGAVEEEDRGTSSEEENYEVNLDMLSLNNISSLVQAPHMVNLKINCNVVMFEVDTGACKTVITSDRFKEILDRPLKSVRYKLNLVSGEVIKAVGECLVDVQFNSRCYKLPLTVIESNRDFVPLLGRNWLNTLFPEWQSNFSNQSINQLEMTSLVDNLKDKYRRVFNANYCSPIKNFEVKFSIKDNTVPVVKKAYAMPYTLKPKVEHKLKQMVDVGILKKVNHSEWASPIVVVPKKNGDVRICTDFRTTINKVLNVDQYPLPKPDDIFATLAGGKIFSVLDLSGAYQQVKVQEDFQKYLTINTHLGMFQFTRLTYGVSCAPAIFQSIMDQMLAGIPHVNCYLDDILIAGDSVEHAKDLLDKVLQRLNKYNVKVNLAKCKFFKNDVEYLGHRIDKDGMRPTEEKLRAINDAPEPKNLTQLRAYLGLINFYSKFVPMFSSKLRPLYKLLEKNTDFKFDKSCSAAFQLSKKLIKESDILTHFDPNKPIVISSDASSYGVGGVLSHREPDGRERPVYFVSGSLSKAEQNYSQLEREALGIIFAVKRFHKYVYGRHFTLISDHQPLKFIFCPDRHISVMSASRIIRWSVILSAYDYQIEYRKGSNLFEADMLSRLPSNEPSGIDSAINSFNLLDELPMTYENISDASKKDTIISKVSDFVKTGWPHKVENEFKPYFRRRLELSVENNCLMIGLRVVIPEGLYKNVLELIHKDHVGIVRAKMLARSICWWPTMQQDIESQIGSCLVCQCNQNEREKFLISWPKTENVFERIHIDFFYRDGIPFLLIVDSKSRWVDIHCMRKGTNATHTIEKLKSTFSVMGLPDMMVSDNGPPFNSNEFVRFCQVNGINILKTPPYHPQSNGSAERCVQTVKKALDKYVADKVNLSVEQQIVHFLFTYRNTPCSITGVSPNEMIFKRKPKTLLDLLKPDKNGKVLFNKQYDVTKPELFSVGEKVLVGKLGPYSDKKWKEGVILRSVSAISYLVSLDDKIMYKHVNSLRKLLPVREKVPEINVTNNIPYSTAPKSPVLFSKPSVSEVEMQSSVESKSIVTESLTEDCIPAPDTPESIPQNVRRSSRVRQPPNRLDL